MDLTAIRKVYKRYAGVYDVVFGPVFEQGRRMAVETANTKANQRVLEVGVGTGLSLPAYRRDARVVGIDISREMLDKARLRVRRLGLDHVEDLLEMDAENMAFPDHSFDAVVAMYVVSVVPNPGRFLAEMRRVCRPGGEIILVNHFASGHPVLRSVERALEPLSATMGFRPNLELSTVQKIAGIEMLGIRDANAFGYWKLVRFRNTGLNGQHAPRSITAAAS